jgi:hypothetical protein
MVIHQKKNQTAVITEVTTAELAKAMVTGWVYFHDVMSVECTVCLTHSNTYVGESNENHKSAIKIRNTAQLSCKLTTVILMV